MQLLEAEPGWLAEERFVLRYKGSTKRERNDYRVSRWAQDNQASVHTTGTYGVHVCYVDGSEVL